MEMKQTRVEKTTCTQIDPNDPIIFHMDMDGVVSFINESGCHCFGFNAEELVGKSISETIAPETVYPRLDLKNMIREVSEAAGAYHLVETRYIRKNGTTLDIRWHNRATINGDSREITCVGRKIFIKNGVIDAPQKKDHPFHLIADTSYGCEKWFGPDGKLKWINPGIERTSGYSKEEYLAMPDPFRTIVFSDDQARVKKCFDTALDKHKTFRNCDYRINHKNGEIRWVLCSWQPIFDEVGAYLGIRSSGQDITVLKLAEERARQLSRAVEQSYHATIITDKDGNIEFVNPAFTISSGFTAEEVMGRNPRIISSGCHPPSFYKSIWATLKKGEVWQGEILNRHKDGHHYWDLSTIIPIKDNAGEITHYCSIQEDITARKKAEVKLLNSEHRLNMLITAIPDAIFFKDGQGRWELINKSAIELFQLQDIAWRGKTDEELAVLRPEFEDLFAQCTLTDGLAWEQGGLDHAEETFIDEHGMEHFLDVSKIPLFSGEGKRRAMVAIARDLTERKREEIALAESEHRLMFALNAAKAGTFYYDIGKDQLEWDKRSMEIFGVQAENFSADYAGWIECLLVEDYARVGPIIKNAMEKESLFDVEFRVAHSDKRIHHVHGQGYTILDQEGNPKALVGLHFDITQKKEKEIALLATQKLTQAILDNALTGIVFLDKDRRIIQANQYLCDMFGFDSTEFVDQNMESFCLPNDSTHPFRESAYHALDPGEIYEAQQRLVHRDSSIILCNLRGRLLEADSPSAGSIWSIEDITERYLAEVQLREYSKKLQAANKKLITSREQLSLAMESANVGLWDWRPKTSELYTNKVFQTMLGYPLDTHFPNTTEKWSSLVHPDDIDTTLKTLETFINRDDSQYRATYRLKSADGSWKWIQDVGRVISRDENGQADRFVGVHIDIDENKRLNMELRAAKRKAEAANQAKSVFLANMSHELRTPLNAVLGFSQLMAQDSSLSEKQLKNILTINRSGNYLMEMINDVLDLSKIEAGHIVKQEEDFDLHELLEDLMEMFNLRAAKKGVKFTSEINVHLPRFIKTDRQKVRQVLINLLGNAVKFTNEGRVILRVWSSNVEEAESGEHIYFEIEDSGIGITNQEQEKLFEPFYQAEARGYKEAGTGLGLSISCSFAKLLAGEITVKSSLGKGSTFGFNLPVQVCFEKTKVDNRRHRVVLRLAPKQPQYRILVCEDHDESREVLCECLEMVGFNVRSTCNGLEAVSEWGEWRPHFIWMDMRMPVMDGYTATRNIKSLPGGEQTIIIALSADAFIQDKEGIVACGCVDFVAKPCSIEYILEVMKRYLKVEYLYKEDQEDRLLETPQPQVDLTKLVAGLSPESRIKLQKAVVLGDSTMLNKALETIHENQEELASSLKQLADSYEYEQILELIR